MGRLASCHKALALYALTTDAEVVVVAARHNWRMFDLTLDCRGLLRTSKLAEPEQTISHVTAWYNTRLEEAIKLSPAQYWWLHRRWKDPRKHKAVKLSDDS